MNVKKIYKEKLEQNDKVHPGKVLATILLKYNINQKELSLRIGLTKKAINEIIKGKNPITKKTSQKLEKVFPISASFWDNIQEKYDINLKRASVKQTTNKEIKDFKKEIQKIYINLTQNNLIPELKFIPKNYQDIVLNVHRFLGVDSVVYLKNIYQDLFNKNIKNIDKYSLATWIRLGEIQLMDNMMSDCSVLQLKKKINTITKQLKNIKNITKVEKTLGRLGVLLVCLPNFSNTKIQSYSKWINNRVLLLINSQDISEDDFFFNIIYQITNIIKNPKKEINYQFINSKLKSQNILFLRKKLLKNIKKIENIREFNKIASDFKIPKHILKKICYNICTKELKKTLNSKQEKQITYINI